MSAYYNENDKFCVEWLRNLIAKGLIADGEVDPRSIVDVRGDDLRGFDQCHFFAGIGVWSYALRQAGWPDDRPVWTGSCPCQPFSAAGQQQGVVDPRHLWPEWFRLIREHKPIAIFGEQVSAAIRHGWLDTVQADLEGLDYAVGAAVMGAHSVGAPHIRQRLYFVADSNGSRRGAWWTGEASDGRGSARIELAGLRAAGELADADQGQRGRVAIGEGRECDGQAAGRIEGNGIAERGGATGELENSECSEGSRLGPYGGKRICVEEAARFTGSGGCHGWWRNTDWLWCADQKYRPVEPGTFPLAHGAAARVGRLRAYGNAIVAPLAAEFVKAFIECRP